MPIRVFSDELRIFLNTRLDKGGPDAEAVYRILCRQHDGATASPNYWMAIPNPKDTTKAIISYSSDSQIQKHGISRDRPRQVWDAEGSHRTQMRAGRWARSLSDVEDGNALDTLVIALDSVFGVGSVNVEFIEGKEAITRAYRQNAHCTCVSIGDLASSCMRYGLGDIFGIYGKIAKLAVVKCTSCGGIQSRAVAWDDGHTKLIDRRYGTQTLKQAILNEALAQGYADVWSGSVGTPTQVNVKLSLLASPTEFEGAPYLDSIPFWCRTCQTLSTRGDACRSGRHDVVHLKGTHGTDHTGWWGRCATCQAELNERRTCRNTRRCMCCNVTWCGGPDSCPNGCIECHACGGMRLAGVAECLNGCFACDQCTFINRRDYLNQSHGRCGGCNAQIYPSEPLNIQMKYMSNGGMRGTCPQCSWKFDALERNGHSVLVPCRSVHDGPYDQLGGHCPSCHAHIILQNPTGDRPNPSTNTVMTGGSDYLTFNSSSTMTTGASSMFIRRTRY